MVHHPQTDSSCQSTTSLSLTAPDAPIVAIATSLGRGSIGVVRLSGADLKPLLLPLLGDVVITPRYAHYLPIYDTDHSLIDQCIVIYFTAPNSYTGEDVLEIQGHGGTAVLQLLLQRCLSVGKSVGLRLANPGEFSLRAYLNDKMDLVQAEAVADLIDASSSAAAKAAAASLSGSFSTEVDNLIGEIVHIRTLVEATLDFPEEEIEFIEKFQVKSRLLSVQAQLSHVLTLSKQSSYLKDGLKVVLAGEPNVGKSSLLNAIFDQDIAIVTDVAGTTRDRIRETLQIDGIPILVTDTAGLRETTDEIEKIGISRSLLAIEESDLILDVVDCRHPVSVLDTLSGGSSWQAKKVLKIYNKCDLLNENDKNKLFLDTDTLLVSAKTSFGIDLLKERVVQVAGRSVGDISPWLGRARHIMSLEVANEHLGVAISHASQDDRVLDLLAEELRLCHDALGQITGAMTADDLLGKIFSSFCIGK